MCGAEMVAPKPIGLCSPKQNIDFGVRWVQYYMTGMKERREVEVR